ncbi:MAG TPA: 3-dehydroquinate synthase [Vicinamibacterales bacterium]|nr:3-dehydroquinate synthase [Vicinamibacterales bacterium]
MDRITVSASSGPYAVVIGDGAIEALGAEMDRTRLGKRRILISSERVWNFHGDRFGKIGADRTPILIEDGERYKNLNTVARLLDALVKAQADRSTVIVAVGGGVIGDMVGFSAATYLRGIPIVHVPTTLLAQVDSAIGGKTGVNHPLGKNLIGSFHPPSLVVADPIVLESLPRREFRAGLYEVIKYGVVSEPALLDRMRESITAIFARDGAAVAPLVAASCRIKASVVSADERESGLRRILNFGHTVGHALEAVTKYKQFRHGEAIGYGMLAALAIGVDRGITPKPLYEEVEALITQLGPLPPVADISSKEVFAAIGRDKKVVNGTLHFIAAADRGKTVELTDVTEKEIKAALKKIGLRA